MSRSTLSPKVIAGIMVSLCFGVSLYLRIVLPYDQVFSGDWIKFAGADAYYHMRLVDNLVNHFPQSMIFDPYTRYPFGAGVFWPPFFHWLLGGIALLVGFGAPTPHTVDIVGVYLPPILAALTVIPVYFIGKELFHRWAGVIAAGLVALLPGEFLGRSILGFTDHHVAEVLFTTVTMLFLMLAMKAGRQKKLTFSRLRHPDRTAITKPIIYSVLAGVFLGIYLLTWVGGLLFVFLIFIGVAVQFVIHHLKNEPSEYLGIVGTVLFLTTLVISMVLLSRSYLGPRYFISLSVASVTPLVLASLSRVMHNRKIAVACYPLFLLGLGTAALAVFYLINPLLLKSMLGKFNIFFPSGAALNIQEVQPILFPGGDFSLSAVWGNFTTGCFLSLIALGLLSYLIIKRGETDKTLLVVWSIMILAASLGQRRFAYYLAINVALLTGYSSWLILQFAGFGKTAIEYAERPVEARRTRRKRSRKRGFGLANSRVYMVLAPIVVFFLVFFPNISPAINTVSGTFSASDDAWYSSLSWLRENTPDPFGDPDFYYQLYEAPPYGEYYQYPDTAYGVLAWWDYGHRITRIAHRIPISNPFQQGVSSVAQFFTAQDEASATEIADQLGAKYVIVDKDIATVGLHALADWAGSSHEEFFDVYHDRRGDELVPILLFYPEYYRSLCVRLYCFDGEAVFPEHCMVISYQERIGRRGVTYREITSVQSAPSYEEATAYISSQKSGNYRIVGDDPSVSPVPLEGLEHYRLIHDSRASVEEVGVGMKSVVKIFEYRR